MKKGAIFLCFIFCLVGFIGPSNATLIVNGGFETGNLTGWSVLNGNVDVLTQDPLGNISPYEGNYMAVLSAGIGLLDASLEQDFVADDYSGFTLSFAYNLQALDLISPDDCCDGDTLTATISASVGSEELISHTINDPFDGFTTTVLGWQTFSETFYLPPFDIGTITLNFTLENFPPGTGDPLQLAQAYIDDVQVNPVPEPATMLLLGTGLVGLAGIGRKKFFKRS